MRGRILLFLALVLFLWLCWQCLEAARADELTYELLINEVSPIASTADWAELYMTSGTGDISGLMLTDLDGEDTALASGPVTLNAGAYAVVHWTSGTDETDAVGDVNGNAYRDLYLSDSSLSGTDDQLVLKKGDQILDAVVWTNGDGSLAESELQDNNLLIQAGAWQGIFSVSNQSGAVPIQEIDTSLARLNSSDTNAKADWQVFLKPSPGAENRLLIPPSKPSLIAPSVSSGAVTLAWENESGLDHYELFETKIKGEYSLPPWEIPASSSTYMVSGLELEQVYYYKLRAVKEAELFTDSDELKVATLAWNEAPEAYVIAPEEISSGVEATFDGSDSYDPEGEPLSFQWSEASNNPVTDVLEKDEEHAVFETATPGKYAFTLTVTDGEKTSEPFPFSVEVLAEAEQDFSKLLINEILPNPAGDDTKDEFIELKNASSVSLNVRGLKLDDVLNGGSSAYTLPDRSIVAGGFLVLKRSETGIALNNDADTVNLLNSDGSVLGQVTYAGNFKEGEAYARKSDGTYARSTLLSAGNENQFSSEEKDEVEEEEQAEEELEEDEGTEVAEELSASSTDADCEEVSLAEARKMIGEEVCFPATVSASWGLLGKNLIYLQDAESALEGYSTTNITAAIGERWQFRGKISELKNGLRLHISSAENLNAVGDLQPLKLQATDFSSDDNALLVRIQGEYVRKRSPSFYLKAGNGELKVSLKKETGLTIPDWTVGEELTIDGILNKTEDGFRILPRLASDLGQEVLRVDSPAELAETGAFFTWSRFIGAVILAILLLRLVKRRAGQSHIA